MGWAFGIDGNGREIGYGVEAECDEPSCSTRIDRGISYRCGPLGSEVDDDKPGCGNFFCGEHLYCAFAYKLPDDDAEDSERRATSLCSRCADALERAQPEMNI